MLWVVLSLTGEDSQIVDGIPGSVLRSGVDVVLYCSSLNEFTSARVAAASQRKGISRVTVLDGGLQMWKERRLPLSREFLSPERAREILGVRLALARS
jgi:3-mercaptopyruvate sulfurtransferase SseA